MLSLSRASVWSPAEVNGLVSLVLNSVRGTAMLYLYDQVNSPPEIPPHIILYHTQSGFFDSIYFLTYFPIKDAECMIVEAQDSSILVATKDSTRYFAIPAEGTHLYFIYLK